MPLRVALQADPIPGLNPATDTSLLLAAEAARRGHALWAYTPDHLSLHAGTLIAAAQTLALHEGKKEFYTLGEMQSILLADMDVILMRQDPPFDMRYISACYMLETLPPSTLVVNDAAFVRNYPEKLIPLHFPDFTPPTLITSDPQAALQFWKEQRDIILKPLYGYGSRSVEHCPPAVTNVEAIARDMIAAENAPIIAQAFLPEIVTGDCRLMFIGGTLSAVLSRVPAEGDIRAAARLGASVGAQTLTPRQRQIAEAVGAFLKTHGVILAGVDLIGDWLIEVNVTSPTLLRQANALYGLTLERDVWDAIESKL